MVRSVTLAMVASFTLLVACGSRGPLDEEPHEPPVAAGPDAGTAIDPTDPLAPDAFAPGDAAPPPPTPPPPPPTTDASVPPPGLDAGGADASREGGTVIDCGSCLLGSCGNQILACVQSTSCRTTLQCVATSCLSGGTPNLACVLGCAAGDLSGALQIFQVFQCATGTCGPDCGAVLGGLLGGGP